MADRIVVLNKGEIEQLGTPLDLYEKPVSRFVAGFLGSPPMNFIPVQLSPGRADLLNGQSVPHAGAAHAQAHLGVRPENLRLVGPDEPALLRGEVSLIEPLGADTLITVKNPAVRLIARVSGISPLRPGHNVGLSWAPQHQHLFDASSGLRVT